MCSAQSRINIKIFLLCLTCFIITGCSNKKMVKEEKDGFLIYTVSNDETEIGSESYQPENTEKGALIEECLKQLEQKPEDVFYKPAKPEELIVKDWELSSDGQLALNFDGSYPVQKGIPEILCRAAIVKTLCQIPDVNFVQFYVNEQPLMNMNEKPIGFMKSEDFINNPGGEVNNTQNAQMTLFFADKAGNKLIETHIDLTYDGTVPMEQLIVEQLIKGPDVIEGVKKGTLYPTMPQGTKLLKATTKDGVCYVDFNSEFLNNTSKVKDSVIIYSVVNSLVESASVNKVKFLINGVESKTYREKIAFDGFFERNLDIVKDYE